MKVLADLHHADLFYSLQLLFEKRLGAELYRPIGMEWYHEKFWNVYPHIDTAQQFLGLNQAINIPKDIHGNPLPESARVNQSYRFEDGIYYVNDLTKDKVQRAITLDKFKAMEFDIIISSMPQHIGPFNRLIQLYQPKAKHIFQVGNAWGQQPGVKNILASTYHFPVDSSINVCFYHQEFDLEIFKYDPTRALGQMAQSCPPRISSHIHYLNNPGLLQLYRDTLQTFTFKTFGAGQEDSIFKTVDEAAEMKKSAFIWQYKPEGDGFGYQIHRAFALGIPPIVWRSHYAGKLAGRLMEDEVTCIDLQGLSVHEGARKIHKAWQPDNYLKMSEAGYNKFKQVVNYDEEEVKIRKFLEELR